MPKTHSVHRSIESLFRQYMSTVFPDKNEISVIQYEETRRAFFASATGILSVMFKLGASNVSDDYGVESLEAWSEEVDRYIKATKSKTN